MITASVLYALYKEDFSFVPPKAAFAGVKWWVVPAYFASLAALSYFRAARWRYLLRGFTDISLRRIITVSWIGFAAILILPLRIGEFVRPYMIRDTKKLTMSAATGTIVAERVVDGLFVSIVLAIALVVVPMASPLPEHVVGFDKISMTKVRGLGFSVLLLFIIAFITIAVFYFQRAFAVAATHKIVGLVSKKLAEKLAGIASNLADGMRFLSSPRDAIPFLLETAAYWGINGASMWLLAWGTGVVHADGSPIRIEEGFALMGMLGAVILIPGPPGLLGVFHVGIYSGLTLYFSEHIIMTQGSVFTFLMYVTQLIWTIGAAVVCLLDPRERAALAQAGQQASAEAEPSPDQSDPRSAP